MKRNIVRWCRGNGPEYGGIVCGTYHGTWYPPLDHTTYVVLARRQLTKKEELSN